MRRQPKYRIAFLNPWSETAENQAFASLAIAAQTLGHNLLHVSTSDEILAAAPDFVIAVASSQPKTTHVPTFVSVHEPRVRYWENEAYFTNLVTYDGYLTISDSLNTFLRAFCAGFGKAPSVGFYYNSPQRQSVFADVASLAARKQLRLCYFGTNWDPRSRPMFRELAKRQYFEVRGPRHSWSYLAQGYCGSVPFDGQSVQSTYASKGAGLVVLSRNHALDDVISNRIFEISSVGALAICPDLQWIRRNFGDTVFYYDPWSSASRIASRIDEIMDEIAANPQAAVERGIGARLAFEKTFCAERMIENAIDYYENWRERTAAASNKACLPTIDVIIRVGGRHTRVIERAIHSISTQSQGQFRVIFVRYQPIDLSEITTRTWSRIAEFEVVDCIGGNRASTLGAGVKALRSQYFAALDDDDFWLPDHIASLWRVLEPLTPGKNFAYCALIEVSEDAADPKTERRQIPRLRPACGTIWDIMGAFGMISFLAARDLVEGLDLNAWTLSTAEDSVLIGHMISRAECAFSWRATACAVTGAGGSDFKNSATRREDVFEAFVRLGSRIEAIEQKFLEPSMSVWTQLGDMLRGVLEQKSNQALGETGVLVLEDGMISASIHDRDDIVLESIGFDQSNVHLAGTSVKDGEGVVVVPPQAPWAYGACIDIPVDDRKSDYWIVLEFPSIQGNLGIGLLNSDKSDFYSRMEAPRRAGPVELWLHVAKGVSVSQVVVQNWGPGGENRGTLAAAWLAEKKS